jgi:hypothetical protein
VISFSCRQFSVGWADSAVRPDVAFYYKGWKRSRQMGIWKISQILRRRFAYLPVIFLQICAKPAVWKRNFAIFPGFPRRKAIEMQMDLP